METLDMRLLTITGLLCLAWTASLPAAERAADNAQPAQGALDQAPAISAADSNRISVSRGRDPFRVSEKMLRQTMSGEYVAFAGGELERFTLPRIEITGVMIFSGESMATAKIEQIGEVTLEADDKFVYAAPGIDGKTFNWFTVKEITANELSILLEGQYEGRGRFR